VQDRLDGSCDETQNLPQLANHGGQTDDRQLFHREQGSQSLASHCLTADAFEADGAAQPLAQHFHQLRAEPVARFFRCDQKNPAR
jgi:hypothetical protein